MKHANDIFHNINFIKYLSGFFMFCFVFCNAVFKQKQRGTRAYEKQHLLVIQFDTSYKCFEKRTKPID